MPVELKRKPPAPSPHGFVQSAGKQEDFFAQGNALAAKLGWVGDDPEMLGNDIAPEDARGFLVKTLHEAHIAGAKGEEKPSHLPACDHLGLSDDADLAAVEAEISEAFESGKGATVTQHAISFGSASASLTLNISEAASAAGKVG